MNNWISVKDRLPESEEWFLVYRRDHGFDIAYHDSKGWFEPIDLYHRGKNVR